MGNAAIHRKFHREGAVLQNGLMPSPDEVSHKSSGRSIRNSVLRLVAHPATLLQPLKQRIVINGRDKFHTRIYDFHIASFNL
jgi:hypothetical protein